MEKSRNGGKSKKKLAYQEHSLFPKQLSNLLGREMTQRALAKKLGVSDQIVSQWRLGEVAPDLHQFIKIAEALDVSYEYLLDGVPSKKRENVDMGEYLGLNDTTIAALHEVKIRSPLLSAIFNRFCTPKFLWGVLSKVKQYWEFENEVHSLEQMANEDHVSIPAMTLEVTLRNHVGVDCGIDKYNDYNQNEMSRHLKRIFDDNSADAIMSLMASAIQNSCIQIVQDVLDENLIEQKGN